MVFSPVSDAMPKNAPSFSFDVKNKSVKISGSGSCSQEETVPFVVSLDVNSATLQVWFGLSTRRSAHCDSSGVVSARFSVTVPRRSAVGSVSSPGPFPTVSVVAGSSPVSSRDGPGRPGRVLTCGHRSRQRTDTEVHPTQRRTDCNGFRRVGHGRDGSVELEGSLFRVFPEFLSRQSEGLTVVLGGWMFWLGRTHVVVVAFGQWSRFGKVSPSWEVCGRRVAQDGTI